jgi:hypothetical protein
MALGRGYRAVYIGWSINSGPLDQTDLKHQCRLDLKGGGRVHVEGESEKLCWWTSRSRGSATPGLRPNPPIFGQ